MKIQHYLDKLHGSTEYKEFQKEHKDAYIVAGFFILDLEQGFDVHQIDFYIPSKKKVAAFNLDKSIQIQIMDMVTDKKPSQVDIAANIDLDTIPGILEDEMKNRGITESIKKVIAILQNIDGKKIWNLNCVLSGMGILKAHVEDESKSVLKMEKASIFDYVKKMPAKDLEKLKKTQGVQPPPAQIKEEISKLDKLEEEIEKQREELQEELKKPGKEKSGKILKPKESKLKK